MIVTHNEIRNAIIKTGLSEKIICLHSSLKSFGHLEGGANTIINEFLKQKCTLVVPTHFYDAVVTPPEGKRILQNGCDYSKLPDINSDKVTAYDSKKIAKCMGAIPAEILNKEECIRGNHPIDSLSAIGPEAKAIIEWQKPLDVYAPFRKIYEDTRTQTNHAFIVLMGVDLTKTTAIHFAEQLSGRRLFRAWAKLSNGETLETQVGSCSDGFNHLSEFVSDIEKTIKVGESFWKIFPFKEFIDKITQAIKENPSITHCGRSDCLRCNDTVRGGAII